MSILLQFGCRAAILGSRPELAHLDSLLDGRVDFLTCFADVESKAIEVSGLRHLTAGLDWLPVTELIDSDPLLRHVV